MKTIIEHLKEILQKNKEDLMYLLIAGIPMLIFVLLFSKCVDYSHLY